MKKVTSAISAFLILTLLLLSFPNSTRAQLNVMIFTVTTAEDTHDEIPDNGICADEFGDCSLRAAMEEADYLFYDHATETTITFGFSQPTTIYLDGNLPNDTPADIIGPNDLSVTIDGQNVATIGLDLGSFSGNTIKNLRLQHFTFAGIDMENYYGTDTIENNIIINNGMRGIYASGRQTVSTSGSISIFGNYIGYDPINEVPGPNGTYGIELDANDFSTTGATIDISGNVISGNESCGIYVSSPDVDTQTVIQGNIIGTNDAGNAAVPNSDGICVYRHSGLLTIGGDTAAEGNLISGNTKRGIFIQKAVNFSIQYNNLSTNPSGTAYLPNIDGDIEVYESSLGLIADNVAMNGISIPANEEYPVTEVSILRNNVGVTRSGFVRPLTKHREGIYARNFYQDCQIGFNQITGFRSGIYIGQGTNTNISNNKIFDVSGLGIEIPPWGTNPNDYMDADDGPNDLQNFPTLTVVRTDYGSYKTFDITAKLHSTPNTQFRVEVFSSDVCFEGGYGEGEEFEKSSNVVQTDSNGNATWQVATIYSWEIAGECFTATASKFLGNGVYGSTSEFARQMNHLYLPTILR